MPTQPSAKIVALLPALALAMATALFAVGDLRAAPATGEMAVVFSPWTGEAEAWSALKAAGGQFVGGSRFPNVVIAYANDSGFAERIRHQGALFVFAATGLCALVTIEPEAKSA